MEGYKKVTGETPDISCWLDCEFYDPVWYWDDPISPDNPQMGRWLGIAQCIGTDLCYFILNMKGNVLSRTIVQCGTKLDLKEDDVKKRLEKDVDLGLDEDDKTELVKRAHADGPDYYSPEAYDTSLNAKFLVPGGDGRIKGAVIKHRKGED
eukprot:12693742-Ditylum_brightwellii.AAC.1